MSSEPAWFNDNGPRHRSRWLASGGFRSGSLNLLGWAAVLLPGMSLGLLAGWLSGYSPPLLAVVGMAVSWVIALGIDYVAWRSISFGVSSSALSVEQARVVAARMTGEGRSVEFEEDVDPEDGSPMWRIRSVNRHRRAIYNAIAKDTRGH